MLSRTEDLVDAWQAMRDQLLAFVIVRVGSRPDAEDIVQDVFIKVGEGINGLRDGKRLEAWIYQVTRNAIIDHQRAAARMRNAEVRAAAEERLTTSEEPDEREALTSLTGCLAPLLAFLGERDRQAITMVEYDGLTQTEAARRLGISTSGMKSRVQRARARLRDLLTQCCQIAVDVRGDVRAIRPSGPCTCAPLSSHPSDTSDP
ncbi:sigma-70 family RNA polymerase sigma factor [Nonomuraea sp. C10]|uniref:sigma-70 family RNA polymerase sigma factor n=1 Tax=Nonomuraea sp. C10 TaxID=2600577 RepID=UPI0011CD677E|nr:sigma-70 family RNA polymerase sigma factor [Nonomuraea sp. C10]TXK40038.1 sigma-70 family RNA polymerase sigma factor [Nonomuraea sp. C10]